MPILHTIESSKLSAGHHCHLCTLLPTVWEHRAMRCDALVQEAGRVRANHERHLQSDTRGGRCARYCERGHVPATDC